MVQAFDVSPKQCRLGGYGDEVGRQRGWTFKRIGGVSTIAAE